MVGSFKVPTIFTAVDKVSQTVDKMQSKVGSFQKSMNKAVNYGAAVGGGVIAASLPFVYDALTQYDDALASFRTIVSDLNDADFSKYKKGIEKVANDTKRSTVDIATSYETIAGLNADFAKTPQSIESVAKANATLAKASRMELGESAESLVGIMNQYDLAADQSDRVINVLAAGQAVGAASIKQTAESYTVFGSVAKGANITLEESTALIQTLGKFSLFGAEAGTKLRGSVLQLQKAGLGYASGQFNINDALSETNKVMNRLGTEKAKDAYLTKLFGAENITAGRILLNNIGVYQEFTKGVTGTSEAQKAAEINSNTLLSKITDLKNGLTNYITTNDESNKSLQTAKDLIASVTDNLDTLIPIVLGVGVGLFVMWIAVKAVNVAMLLGQGIMWAYTGIMAAYEAVAITAALGGYTFAGAIWATLWPVLLVIAAIAAIIAIFYYWDEICAWFAKQWEKFTNWIGELWGKVVKWFQEFSFENFFKSIGNSIIEWMLAPLQTFLLLVSKIPGKIGDMAKQALEFTSSMRFEIEPTQQAELAPQTTAQVSTSESITTNKSSMQVNFNDKNNNIAGIQQFGNPIPVFVNNTKYGK